MSIIMNESIGAVEYDGLINSAYPADVIHASLASGYGKLKRGTLIARASNGSLIPWGSDITNDLVEVLTVSNHQATKAQAGAGLRTALLKVFALNFDVFVEIKKTADYTVTYSPNTLTVTLVQTSDYYDTPKVKIICPYTYDEGTIAAANLILAEDIDTGETLGSTVIARVYRTGIFNRKAILHDPKAVDGINDVTKEKLRSVGIYLNDSISI